MLVEGACSYDSCTLRMFVLAFNAGLITPATRETLAIVSRGSRTARRLLDVRAQLSWRPGRSNPYSLAMILVIYQCLRAIFFICKFLFRLSARSGDRGFPLPTFLILFLFSFCRGAMLVASDLKLPVINVFKCHWRKRKTLVVSS